jgi:glutamate dehydrogenase
MISIREIANRSVLSETQLKKIEKNILSHGNYTQQTVREEIELFCTGLCMNDYYFQTTPIQTIASHIEALKAAEILASLRKEEPLKIDFGTETEKEAIYLVDDSHYRALEIEKRIEDKYPDHRLQSYRAECRATGIGSLRMYFVSRPKFKTKEKIQRDAAPFDAIADESFLKNSTPEACLRYQKLLKRSDGWETPLIEVSHKKETNELRIMVITHKETSRLFFTNVSDVIHSYNLISTRKYIEHFANGKTVYAFYLDDVREKKLIQDLVEDISLVYVVPESPLSFLFREGQLSAQETAFGVSAWSFTHQFLTEYTEEYLMLNRALKDSPELVGLIRTMKTRLAKFAYDEARVWDTLVENRNYLKKSFRLFNKKFNPFLQDHDISVDLAELKEDIKRHVNVEIDRNILDAILLFVEVIQRTNFYKREKTSLSYMYNPSFLNPVDYPVPPYGVFHVIALELRGFHIRFRDIARGGIRIVHSSNYQNFLNNSDFIFDENYNLALTQQKKNKDIPEGGSKGTILLRWKDQDKEMPAFKKYINGLLDLLLPDETIVDFYGKEVILFLGPDEGTADFMAWAALRAKNQGYSYWQAFSTGKPVSMGGIPHDLYGMTTNSVHQYVLNILDKEGIQEKNVTKVMTGGPDGDLGSNEILVSRDRILAIIDGSGVLYDPKGLDRKELRRLAKRRIPVENFRRELLSSQGFLVTVGEEDVSLAHGEKVDSGLEFRNSFHLDSRFQADLFVPCGGRPASINIHNWKELVDEKGRPRFKYIVEGANLFITQDARLRLEEKGVILYKDASANKGGVTSSSLEVFASLALSDKEYEELMCEKNGKIPSFRKRYIEEIILLIKDNASKEFEIIWKENAEKNIPRAILTDQISDKINQITDAVYASKLFDNRPLFKNIVECCCPSSLINQVGFKTILKRVPESYLKAVFASHLASTYVYTYGLNANEIDFHTFLLSYS